MTREMTHRRLYATDMRFALVVGRWNHFISDRLVRAMDAIVATAVIPETSSRSPCRAPSSSRW